MHLQCRLQALAKSWLHPHIGDPRGITKPTTRHVHRIHAAQRRADAVQRDIGCRCIQLPAQFLPVLNTPGHFERPTEEALRAIKIRVGQRSPNARAAHSLSGLFQGRRGGNSIAKFFGQRADIIQIPLATITETKVVTKGQILHTKPLDKYLFDKLPGAELAQVLVKGQAKHTVDMTGLK